MGAVQAEATKISNVCKAAGIAPPNEVPQATAFLIIVIAGLLHIPDFTKAEFMELAEAAWDACEERAVRRGMPRPHQ